MFVSAGRIDPVAADEHGRFTMPGVLHQSYSLRAPLDGNQSFDERLLREYFVGSYTPRNLIVSAVGNLEHAHVRELVEERFGSLKSSGEPTRTTLMLGSWTLVAPLANAS